MHWGPFGFIRINWDHWDSLGSIDLLLTILLIFWHLEYLINLDHNYHLYHLDILDYHGELEELEELKCLSNWEDLRSQYYSTQFWVGDESIPRFQVYRDPLDLIKCKLCFSISLKCPPDPFNINGLSCSPNCHFRLGNTYLANFWDFVISFKIQDILRWNIVLLVE